MKNRSRPAHRAASIVVVISALGGCATTPLQEITRDFGPITVTSFNVSSATAVASKAASPALLTVMPTGTKFVLDGASTDTISVIVGQQVAFRNVENTAHDIYSASPLNTFDTGVLQNGESQTVLFDRPGILDIQCAIHPEMRLTVRVED